MTKKPFKLDMDFDEAMKRFSNVKKEEVDMADELERAKRLFLHYILDKNKHGFIPEPGIGTFLLKEHLDIDTKIKGQAIDELVVEGLVERNESGGINITDNGRKAVS